MKDPLLTSRRILVVDDERPILFALRDYFSLKGLIVDCAEEMEEAQALLANVSYSLVIVDMRLTGFGGVEGLEVVGFVKDRCPQTRVIVWTASESSAVKREVHRRGVDRYIQKPAPLADVARAAFELLGAPAYA
ncbi:MAG TPA: response regulator [Blastocatellia bacterium]|nr:response regulator [Blastocatellia bacterium]